VVVPADDRHDRDLEAWVLAAVAELDREGLALGLGVRELPVTGVAEQAGLDERVVGVVVDRLAQRGLVRLIAHADPARVVLTPQGLRTSTTEPAPAERPTPDGARFVFLRPAAPHGAGGGRFADDEQVCDFHPQRRRKGTMDPGEHCDGSGWIVDAVTRESRACRCRPLRIRRNRDRRLGGPVTNAIKLFGLATSLRPELHPAVRTLVDRWLRDLDGHLRAGSGLWMTIAPWDRQLPSEALDQTYAPPQSQEEFEQASARAAQALDHDVVAAMTQAEQTSRSTGEVSLMEVQRIIETAAGSAAAAIAREADNDRREVAWYTLSGLYRSLVYLSRFGGYRARLQALQECELLCLVGLDHRVIARAPEWQRDWLREQLELIAIGRYENQRATVVVSNGWPLEELVEALSPETYHRLQCAAGEPLLGSRIPEKAMTTT
jgi:hypothetical protein